MRAPKILFLNPWKRLIGPNRYLVELLRYAPELAVQATIVFDKPRETLPSDGASEYEALGCQIAVWPETAWVHMHPTFTNGLHLLNTHTLGLMSVIRRLRALRPDLVVTNTEIVWVGGMAAKLLRIPHLQIFHAITFKERLGHRPALLRGYLAFISFWSQKVIAVSETLATALLEGGVADSKIAVVPNPLPVTRLQAEAKAPLPAEWQPFTNRYPLLLCTGQISPMKGQDMLIEALPAIREQYPDLLCLFAGELCPSSGLDDTEGFYQQLLQRVGELGLESHLSFLGEVDNLPILLHQADVYVQPSRTESFGRVVAEALVCGTPVVAFAVGGIPEVVGAGGVLVPSGNLSQLAEAILSLLSDSDEAKARVKQGQVHVQQQFDVAQVASRFRDVARQAISHV
jgi:glycosyltransferase involved in cell wall biosynthesis